MKAAALKKSVNIKDDIKYFLLSSARQQSYN
jgi:hypothetical protein